MTHPRPRHTFDDRFHSRLEWPAAPSFRTRSLSQMFSPAVLFADSYLVSLYRIRFCSHKLSYALFQLNARSILLGMWMPWISTVACVHINPFTITYMYKTWSYKSTNTRCIMIVISHQLFFVLTFTRCVFFFKYVLRLFQITVYLGKRDFVDHLDQVDPVGELSPHLEFRLT